MPPPSINDTSRYYRSETPSLFWELTICQSLASGGSPYQTALERPAPYGVLLARFLAPFVGIDASSFVVEVGGGYGSLMASFLDEVAPGSVEMVDISPFFSARQREELAGRPECGFVTADVLEYLEAAAGRQADLVISNENLGDLPAAEDVCREDVLRALAGKAADPVTAEVASLVAAYELPLDGAPERFHFNAGAIRYLEALRPFARAVFLSEHGSDTVLPPPYEFLPLEKGDGYPRRIRLRGHVEYSIRFGDLALAAERLGYEVRRWHMAEMVGLRSDAGIRFMASAPGATDTAEAVHEFCAHVAEYQCMLLTR